MLIPKVLQDPRINFVKLRPGSKIPIEKGWQDLKYTSSDAAKWDAKYNVGLQGSQNFIILDIDQDIGQTILERLPSTAITKTGSGGTHAYFFTKDARNIIVNNEDGRVFDVQAEGRQAVMPGSKHPNGNYYTFVNDVPIAEIDFNILNNHLKPFGKVSCTKVSIKRKKTQKANIKPANSFNDYPFKISDVLRELNFDAVPGEGWTDTPFGISVNKKCLHYDDDLQIWCDFNKEDPVSMDKFYAGSLRRLLYLLKKRNKLPKKFEVYI